MNTCIQADGKIVAPQTHLTKKQTHAVGLLSIGTFLEYFDLMLYVHMAVLLNELFFPKTDSHTASLITAFAYCSTFVFRPIGALIFGWIGDNIGRRITVVITTVMMAISCIVMANLPTYQQIGNTAIWIITICRIIQGISSMGERVGAELYLTEITKPPIQYPAVTLITVCSSLGAMAALGTAHLAITYGFNWRIAFWLGAFIAIIGAKARITLRETPEFANAKRRLISTLNKALNVTIIDKKALMDNPIWQEKIDKRTALAYFLIQCAGPLPSYFAYFYCSNILKNAFSYNAEAIIYHNFIVSIVQLLSVLLLTYLSYKIYPLKIIKVKWIIFSIFILFCPYLLNNINTTFDLFLIQASIILSAPDAAPGAAIFYKYFPVFKRFTCGSFIYALSHALIFVITSFGLVYLTEYFGHYGLLVIMLPVAIGYGLGVYHFEKLEEKAGRYL